MRELQRIILEGIIVLAAGAGVALVANAVSPKGLSLTRDYFHTRSRGNANHTIQPAYGNADFGQSGTSSPDNEGTSRESGQQANEDGKPEQAPDQPVSSGNSDTEVSVFTGHEREIAEQLKAEGLHPMTHEQVVKLYNDPGYQNLTGEILFIDARNADHYHDGHIPGAAHLDHYYLDDAIDSVLPLCQNALQIVVYCNGGECEDSQLAAEDLRNYGVDPSKIHVYIGGMKDWKAARMPLEIGDRNSGNIK